MAPTPQTLLQSDSDGDYGYDLSSEQELELIRLASDNEAGARLASTRRPRQPEALAADAQAERLDATGGDCCDAPSGLVWCLPSAASVAADDGHPDLRSALSERGEGNTAPAEADCAAGAEAHVRSPLQRFRTFPRKPLSVSDLTSGAWCELQYWYTLTRLRGGRRTRTPAMKEGSRVHRELEDQVHTTVRVDIRSKEEGFGLRLWNLVQGLTALRETGLTRELEVWGLVDGNMVNGIIDAVSRDNGGPEFPQELPRPVSQPGLQQSTLTDYFSSKQKADDGQPAPSIYLADVKTRMSLAPVSDAVLRPAKMQLLLYHRLLSDMAAGRLDFFQVFERYALDPDHPFSDAFQVQIGDVHDEVFHDASSSPATSSCLNYQTLRELLPLVYREIRLTFPEGQESLSHVLRVQYVYRDDGRELEVHDFPVSRQTLDAYLEKYMSWWRGERTANGVDIEEAFKCRSCEFASDCSWRQSMDEQRVQGAQKRMRAARRASKAR